MSTPESARPLRDTAAVAEFMTAFGQTVRTSPTTDITDTERLLRARLVFEEAYEFVAAMGCNIEYGDDGFEVNVDDRARIDLVEATDAIADLIVVTKGSAHTLGVDPDAAFDIVHATNMAKAPGGVVTRRADGKIIKPEGWEPPTVALRALIGLD